MSKLEFYARPWVAFDPKNKEHRRWYYEFVEYGGWGKCPVRFICPDSSGSDLTVMIRNQLIEYYIYKEFETGGRIRSGVAKTPQKKVVQKGKKTVDKQPK